MLPGIERYWWQLWDGSDHDMGQNRKKRTFLPSIGEGYEIKLGSQPVAVVCPQDARLEDFCHLLGRLLDGTMISHSNRKPMEVTKEYISALQNATEAKILVAVDVDPSAPTASAQCLISKDVEPLLDVFTAVFSHHGIKWESTLDAMPSASVCVVITLNHDDAARRDILFAVCALATIVLETSDEDQASCIQAKVRNYTPQSVHPMNRIELPFELFNDLQIVENERIRVIDFRTGASVIGTARLRSDLKDHEVVLSNTTRERLRSTFGLPQEILLRPVRSQRVHRILTQSIAGAKTGYVTISREMYEELARCGDHFEFVNLVTGASMDFPIRLLRPSDLLNREDARFSYYHRQLLDLNVPYTLSEFYYNQYISNPSLSDEERELLRDYFGNDKILPNLSYAESERLRFLLQKVGYFDIAIYPYRSKDENSLPRRALTEVVETGLKLLIGDASMQLKVIRPYTIDEVNDVVRVSSHVLMLLGLEETDDVYITYRNRSVKARIFAIDSLSSVSETNVLIKESDLDMSIGIPSHLRRELGMNSIGCVCTLRRNLPYLFLKNLNIQWLPILGVVFTLFQIPMSTMQRMILLVVLVPLSIYVTFSRERAKVTK